jgi:hypothetical protein
MFCRSVPCWMISSLTLFPLVSLAQNPDSAPLTAPPEIEQALRGRVSEFFQHLVEADFRRAYSLVAEDTKEYYFNTPMGDSTFESFRITGVRFLNGDFTKASVNLECRQKMHEGEFAGAVVSVPIATLWKIEDRKWMWHHEKGLPRHYL